MAKFKFEMPTRAQAVAFFPSRSYQSESYPDAIACAHAVMEHSTPRERELSQLFARVKAAPETLVAATPRSSRVDREYVAQCLAAARMPTYPCAGCGRYAFATTGVVCFWCRHE